MSAARHALGRLRSILLGGAPGVSRRDVIAAFEVVRGQPPDSEAEIRRHLGFPNRAALGRHLAQAVAAPPPPPPPPAPPAAPAPVFLGDSLLGRTHRGALIYLAPEDVDLTPHLVTGGRWKSHIEAVLERLLRPGQVVADLGANVGYHTLVMAEAVGPAGRVEAFEASPAAARLLRRTLAVNGLERRVTLHEAAALDSAGRVTLASMPEHLGSGHVAVPATGTGYALRVEVPAVTLDAALAGLPALDLLRMDIEGAEPLALRGAEALLDRSPDLRIVTEWSPGMIASRMAVAEFAAWLTARRFDAWVIEADASLSAVPPAALPDLPHADLVLARVAPE